MANKAADDDESSKRDEHVTQVAVYQRMSTAAELAYQLGVPPQPSALYRAVELRRKINSLPRPFFDSEHDSDPHEVDEYRSKLKQLEEEKLMAPRGSHVWSHALAGRRNFTRATRDCIKEVGPSAHWLWEHPFWPLYELLPTGTVDYETLISFFASSDRVKGCLRWDRQRRPLPRPPISLVEHAEMHDSLTDIGFLLLLIGAAHEEQWFDLYDRAFRTLLSTLSRIACVPPFRKFGGDFAMHVVRSVLLGNKPIPPKRGPRLRERIDRNIELLKQADHAGLFFKNEICTFGLREEQLAFLRYAETTNPTELRKMLSTWDKTGARSPRGRELVKVLERAKDDLVY